MRLSNKVGPITRMKWVWLSKIEALLSASQRLNFDCLMFSIN